MTERTDTVGRIATAVIATGTEPWQFQAACIDQGPTMDATRAPRVWDALKVCAQCPVVAECHSWAENEVEYVGVAGGAVWTTRHRNRRSTTHALDVAAS